MWSNLLLTKLALISIETSSTGAQSTSAGLQATSTAGTGTAARAKQGIFGCYCLSPNFVLCTCLSKKMYKTNMILVEIIAVLSDLELI